MQQRGPHFQRGPVQPAPVPDGVGRLPVVDHDHGSVPQLATAGSGRTAGGAAGAAG